MSDTNTARRGSIPPTGAVTDRIRHAGVGALTTAGHRIGATALPRELAADDGPRSRPGRGVFVRDAALYAVFAAVAATVALSSAGQSFRWWGSMATVGYAAGAAVALLLAQRTPHAWQHAHQRPRRRLPIPARRIRHRPALSRWACWVPTRRARSLLLALVTTAVTGVPLVVQAALGVAVSEVEILREAGIRLWETGTPYPGATELAAASGPTAYQEYNVYLPVLALFGLPSAWFGTGMLTDPRWLLAITGALAFLATGRGWYATLWVGCAAPLALGLVSGSNDYPVIGLICLGMAFVYQGGGARSAIATGLAAGMKIHAWPALVIFFLYAAVRHGRAEAARFLGVAAVVLSLCVGLPAVVAPEAFVINVIRLPLGLEDTTLLANTPLPGHLLAASGSFGRWVGLGLLALGIVTVLAWLLRRPPRDLVSAAYRLAGLFLVGILLAPQARLGYFAYPLVPLMWLAPESWRRMRHWTLRIAGRYGRDRDERAHSDDTSDGTAPDGTAPDGTTQARLPATARRIRPW